MKKISLFFAFIFLLFFGVSYAQNARSLVEQEITDPKSGLGVVTFVHHAFATPDACAMFLLEHYIHNSNVHLKTIKEEKDEFGFTHVTYQCPYQNTPIQNKLLKIHTRDGNWVANGDLSVVTSPVNSPVFSEEKSLRSALNKIGAKVYKWELEDETEHVRKVMQNPSFTYFPKGELVLLCKNNQYRYAWKFNIYSHEPLYRAWYFVDAQTGKVIEEYPLICSISVPGTANTKYSGVKSFTIDQNGAIYRLRENTKGLGVETYNLQNGTNYASAIDFTNTSTTWSLTGPDQGVVDAHWGAEMSYDYYMQIHNRNSLDGNGYKLLSYCHYSTNYNNAFWDGQRMTYGDGNGTSFTIFTCLDVCGHELTHGLTNFTGNLNYQNESGALNESWSDIFGTCIENFGKPTGWNWKIGNEITTNNQGIRDMQNPKLFSEPNCYQGQYWYTGTADNGGVHTNSGVGNYWYYLLTAGGTGTNDIGNSYTFSGIGIIAASRIAFRAMTVYFTPTTNYANARALTIQAAKDLFGSCSNEVVQCTNAWYACGVGGPYTPGTINPNFVTTNTVFCSVPATVNFQNTTANGNSYIWYFGNGATSSSVNPVYTYTSPGVYTVKLKAYGCNNTVDSITKTSYISISTPPAPNTSVTTICQNQNAVLNASGSGQIVWLSSPNATTSLATGNTFTTPTLSSNTTYYVVNQLTNTPVAGGIPSNTVSGTSGGYLTNPAQYLIFDVLQSCKLISVDVYAQSVGTRTFELRNSSNQVLASWGINLNAGLNTINLNQNLNPGTSYQLGLNASSTANLFRTNSGVAYPYSISAGVNITGSSAGSGFYYWFYNWIVQKDPCKSVAVPVTVTVSPSGSPTITLSQNQVCANAGPVNLSANPGGGIFSGPGVSGSQFNPSSVGPGNYLITYSPSAGCFSSSQASIQVNPLPVISVNSPTICQGQSTTLTAAGANSYTWSNNITGSQLVVSPVFSSSFAVGGTDLNGCTATQNAYVTVNPLPNVSASASQTMVFDNAGYMITLNGSPSGGTFSGPGLSANQFDPSVGAGTYTLTYSYTDNNSCTNSASILMVVNNCTKLSFSSLQNEGVILYPNPFSNYIEIKNQENFPAQIRIFDVTGKQIYSASYEPSTTQRIQTSSWSAGVYVIYLKIHSQNRYIKFIKE